MTQPLSTLLIQFGNKQNPLGDQQTLGFLPLLLFKKPQSVTDAVIKFSLKCVYSSKFYTETGH